MIETLSRIRTRLRATDAGAVAGIVFSLLLITSLVLIRVHVPADPHDAGALVAGQLRATSLAVNLVPFAAIAFLWFIGVLRHGMGNLEDRFFASVFLGSGLLFLAMLLAASAVAGAIIDAHGVAPGGAMDPTTYVFARSLAHGMLYVNAMRMAGVFMISTSMIALRTALVPRWMAFLGFALALMLLLGLSRWPWIPLVFPAWVLIVSSEILLGQLRRSDQGGTGTGEGAHGG